MVTGMLRPFFLPTLSWPIPSSNFVVPLAVSSLSLPFCQDSPNLAHSPTHNLTSTLTNRSRFIFRPFIATREVLQRSVSVLLASVTSTRVSFSLKRFRISASFVLFVFVSFSGFYSELKTV